MIYEDMSIEEVINYINKELLKGRAMKDIEENDFNVNERVITKRLGRKGIKKVDGQFVLQSGSKMPKTIKKQVIEPIIKEVEVTKVLDLNKNEEFLDLTSRVDFIEKALKEIICVQSGSKVVTNDLGLKLYSSNDKPVAKTIRLYQDIWDKLDKVKEQFPHINYQTLLNSLIDEITEKYLK
ncbi:MAG: hypothetical protein ACRDB9_00980 [Cetobacterium sp.]